MYLSKLTLNPRNEQAQTDLASPYELHRTLGKAFEDADSERHRARHGVLFRIEEAGHRGAPVLVQSTSAPDWSRLPQGYVLRLDGPKAFEPAFGEGQHLRFRLVANPIRRVRIDGKEHPRRLALVHPEAKDGVETGYLDWLGRQAATFGFAVVEVADVPFRLDRKRRVGAEEIAKARIPHFGVRFDGVLRVTEPNRLAEAVRKGIGPAKAFGFGLLSLAPIG
jgi:CRISPR system Cascade subunit CasE